MTNAAATNYIQRAIYREIGHGLNPKVLRIVRHSVQGIGPVDQSIGGGDNPGITELVLRE